jgi:hypothetical protein
MVGTARKARLCPIYHSIRAGRARNSNGQRSPPSPCDARRANPSRRRPTWGTRASHVSSGRRGWCVCPGCGAARRAARAASRLAPIEVARRGAPLIRDLRKLRPWRGGRAGAVASKVPDLQCMMAAAHARLSDSRCCSTLRPCCDASGTQALQPVTLQTTGQEQGRPANNRRGTGSL